MHHAVEQLLQLMPATPNGGDALDWDRVDAQFGWRLPSDYRDFVAAFGMGTINETLSIVTPPPSDYPYAHHLLYERTYPPADGLLLWGATDCADDFYWRCEDADPDRWTVAVRTRSNGWHDYPHGMTDFLLQLLSGRIKTPLNADLGIDQPPTFESWREEVQQLRESDDSGSFGY
ncbi:hypothetical protein [Streptacidiphilus jiangxiensis]|uniref:SMI1-KNR4 cell-wall n=1 Tax=Streptacidiphilus jiangxiensis TaxID=235985 RepID=A0A1H7PB33_STRJI|nr:hypothetical protein [Streptacidiphilus jiangxiensis]SEL32826.1 hypothetical protein SAMN05414137_107296 [Streptacidiphilus jiangxiensis]